jgi:hypothetical protein
MNNMNIIEVKILIGVSMVMLADIKYNSTD